MGLADFLAAKFALDERSVNADVRSALLERLSSLPQLDCLDVGAGSGASARRLLAWRPMQPWRLTLLDRDGALLAAARRGIVQALAARGHDATQDDAVVRACAGRIEVRCAECALEAYDPPERYDLVIAHAVLDLVVLRPALERLRGWLRPGGYLYCAIHHDGETVLDPPYADPGFERALIACYTESMERRRIDGERTGGAYCGRRLQALLPELGFEIVAAGASDWHMRPVDARYPDGDEACLVHLLGLVLKEGRQAGFAGAQALQRWHDDRSRQIRARRLGLHVSNRDVLARRPEPQPDVR